MTECLAVEWARFNINVNAIAPGAFSSEMMDGMLERMGDFSSALKTSPALAPSYEPERMAIRSSFPSASARSRSPVPVKAQGSISPNNVSRHGRDPVSSLTPESAPEEAVPHHAVNLKQALTRLAGTTPVVTTTPSCPSACKSPATSSSTDSAAFHDTRHPPAVFVYPT